MEWFDEDGLGIVRIGVQGKERTDEDLIGGKRRAWTGAEGIGELRNGTFRYERASADGRDLIGEFRSRKA